MIYLYLKGGLGNQMFQYAFARSIQKSKNDKIVVMKDELNGKINYLKLLNAPHEENLAVNKATFFLYRVIRKCYSAIFKIFAQDICIKTYKFTSLIVNKLGFYYCFHCYIKPFKRLTKHTTINGYFQCEKYFIEIKEDIKKELKVSLKPTPKENKWISKIKSTESVCVHIRRGDYVKFAQIHLVCDINYYINAVNEIKKHVKNPTFYVFSDDIPWCKSNIDFGSDVNYIDDISVDYQELRLMYTCDHFVISNSSFSYWAQYLSDNKNKVVIAPSKWYNNDIPTNIFMDDWILLDV